VHFTDIFIRRPVLALVISALLLIVGLASLSRVQLREFPQLERSVIYVETVYPGANARTIQGFVTTPLQVNIAGARGVEYITSTSNPGVSSIEVHVRLGENTSDVLTEVIAKVNESRDELPEDVRDPVITTATGGEALIYIAFTSEQMTPYQVTDYLLRSVQPELATLDGVGKAAIYGRYLAMRVWLDPVRMAALGVTASDIAAAISRDNVISTAGSHRGRVGPHHRRRPNRRADGGRFPRPRGTPGRGPPGAPRRRRGRRTGRRKQPDAQLFLRPRHGVRSRSRRPPTPTRCRCRAPCARCYRTSRQTCRRI
jgi:multidrug efflux pump subunit AcrB